MVNTGLSLVCILLHFLLLQEKHEIPGNRKPVQQYDINTTPFLELNRPKFRTKLDKEVTKKHSGPVELMVAELQPTWSLLFKLRS